MRSIQQKVAAAAGFSRNWPQIPPASQESAWVAACAAESSARDDDGSLCPDVAHPVANCSRDFAATLHRRLDWIGEVLVIVADHPQIDQRDIAGERFAG